MVRHWAQGLLQVGWISKEHCISETQNGAEKAFRKIYRRRTRPPVCLSPISAKAEEYDLLQEYELLKKVSEGRFNQNEKLLLTDVKQKQEIHQTNITLQLQLQNKTLVSPKKNISLKRGSAPEWDRKDRWWPGQRPASF